MLTLCAADVKWSNDFSSTYRVKKFFGEDVDVEKVAYYEKLRATAPVVSDEERSPPPSLLSLCFSPMTTLFTFVVP